MRTVLIAALCVILTATALGSPAKHAGNHHPKVGGNHLVHAVRHGGSVDRSAVAADAAEEVDPVNPHNHSHRWHPHNGSNHSHGHHWHPHNGSNHSHHWHPRNHSGHHNHSGPHNHSRHHNHHHEHETTVAPGQLSGSGSQSHQQPEQRTGHHGRHSWRHVAALGVFVLVSGLIVFLVVRAIRRCRRGSAAAAPQPYILVYGQPNTPSKHVNDIYDDAVIVV